MQKSNIVSPEQRRQIRRLIRESIIQKQLLFEERSLIIEQICHYNSEKDALGYTPKMIEEGILDLFGSGLMSGVKQNFVEYILQTIGFKTDSIVGNFVVNLIENMNILGMNKYFGEGKCNAVAELVAKASVETINEIGSERVISLIYSQFSDGRDIKETKFGKNIERGLGKLIAAAGREIVNEVIYDFIGPMVEEPIVNIFCSYNSLKDFFMRGVFQGELGGQLKDVGKVAAAGVGLGAADKVLDVGEDELAKRGKERISGKGDEAARNLFRKTKSQVDKV